MKKSFFTFLLALGCVVNASAQLYNGDFEIWTKTNPSYPIDWRAMGWEGCFGPTGIVCQDQTPNSGIYNAMITTQYGGFASQPMEAVLFNGDVSIAPTCGFDYTGSPINYIPTSISGAYSYDLPNGGNDWAEVTVVVRHGDTVLAEGSLPLYPSIGYQNFSVGITPVPNAPVVVPTSILVMFHTNSFYRYSAAPNPACPFAVLRVDDVIIDATSTAIPTGTWIDPIASPNPAQQGVWVTFSDAPLINFCGTVCPNPSVSQMTIGLDNSSQSDHTLQLLDMEGMVVKELAVNLSQRSVYVTLDGISPGIYFCRITHADSAIPSRTTRVVVK